MGMSAAPAVGTSILSNGGPSRQQATTICQMIDKLVSSGMVRDGQTPEDFRSDFLGSLATHCPAGFQDPPEQTEKTQQFLNTLWFTKWMGENAGQDGTGRQML